jgi:hypothetical protein
LARKQKQQNQNWKDGLTFVCHATDFTGGSIKQKQANRMNPPILKAWFSISMNTTTNLPRRSSNPSPGMDPTNWKAIDRQSVLWTRWNISAKGWLAGAQR